MDSLTSLDLVLILRPSEEMKATADELGVPKFFECYRLEDVGVGRFAEFSHFLEAASSAAAPGV